MLQLDYLEVCWRSNAFPYQALPVNLTALPTSADAFTPTTSRSYLPFVLIVSGSNLGRSVYVKLATDCGSSASDTFGTIPGSEGVLPSTHSPLANTYNFRVVSLVAMDLHVCWRAGPGRYARVGLTTLSVAPIQVTNFIPKTGVSNTVLSVTVTGSGFIASPSNLLVRLKLTEDCRLDADSHASTCGVLSGDCVAGGAGVRLASTADGGLSGVFPFTIAAVATHPLDLCWSLDTSPPAYTSLGLGKLSMPPPTATSVSFTPTAPSVHQTIVVSITGTGLALNGLVAAKLKLARVCVGYDDAEPAHDIPGGEARLLSCASVGGSSGTASFKLRSSSSAFKVCFAPGSLGTTGLWSEVGDATGRVSFAISAPRVLSASLLAGTPVANVPFRARLRGQGFGSVGEKVKVKVVPESTGCVLSLFPPCVSPAHRHADLVVFVSGVGIHTRSSDPPTRVPATPTARLHNQPASAWAALRTLKALPLEDRRRLSNLSRRQARRRRQCRSRSQTSEL